MPASCEPRSARTGRSSRFGNLVALGDEKYDAAGKTQPWHVWHDGAAWQSVLATTDLTHRMDMSMSIASHEVERPAVVCAASGRTC